MPGECALYSRDEDTIFALLSSGADRGVWPLFDIVNGFLKSMPWRYRALLLAGVVSLLINKKAEIKIICTYCAMRTEWLTGFRKTSRPSIVVGGVDSQT
jgi:hypothetical protein